MNRPFTPQQLAVLREMLQCQVAPRLESVIEFDQELQPDGVFQRRMWAKVSPWSRQMRVQASGGEVLVTLGLAPDDDGDGPGPAWIQLSAAHARYLSDLLLQAAAQVEVACDQGAPVVE